MKIVFNERAWQEYMFWVSNDKMIVKKINELIKDIIRNPYSGIGKPEKLKYDKKDFKSHLTLARVKKVYDNDKLKEIINNIRFEKSSFLANSITLYESNFVNYREIFTVTF